MRWPDILSGPLRAEARLACDKIGGRAGALLVLLALGCGSGHGEDALPTSQLGVEPPADTRVLDVSLDPSGSIRCSGKEVTLDGLTPIIQATASRPEIMPVVTLRREGSSVEDVTVNRPDWTGVEPRLTIPVRAVWGQVQWLLAVLAEHGAERAQLALADGKVMPIPLNAGRSWEKDPPQAGGTRISIAVNAAGEVEYRHGDTVVHDPASLKGAVASGAPAVLGVDVDRQVPFASCVAALELGADLGIPVELGVEAPGPWVRRQEHLPFPLRTGSIPCWERRRRWWDDVVRVEQPAARNAVPLPDFAGRVLVTLDREGVLRLDGEKYAVWNLSTPLALPRRIDVSSPRGLLPIVVGADRSCSWRQVRWVLAQIASLRVRRIDLLAQRTADLSWSGDEARVLDLDRENLEPDAGFQRAFALRLAFTGQPREEGTIDVEVYRTQFTVSGSTADAVSELPRPPGNTQFQVSIEADPDVRFDRVVAALGRYAQDGYVTLPGPEWDLKEPGASDRLPR